MNYLWVVHNKCIIQIVIKPHEDKIAGLLLFLGNIKKFYTLTHASRSETNDRLLYFYIQCGK